ncbi:Gfo/Idh/MocA family protein [Sagittula salina]|uniref:Gfo/Idh/MocA family oxidoreductase n=1 Tax=Sagittula salina TaxID=2820268 RepID=A0A940S0Y6_9RHOB|nr:Gfo/Idh/MocA family oxidoreductase [Sagittula salina]MBP0482507.1 Gfo/Idh/MocA family oxidoreductase [Sagittula salina]
MTTVAIIGAGIGREHLAAYQQLPELFEVVTLCDLDVARAKAVAGPCGVAVCSSLDAVLASDVDLIDICLPPHLHLAACEKALAAGKDVICEKPLVASLAEADRLIAAAEASGRRVFPVFQYRYGPGTAQLRAVLESGLVGKLYAGTIETHWNRDAAYYAVDWRGTWAGERGGAILGHAIHIHDYLPAFLGPVARVYAELATRVNDIDVEDCAALSLRMQSGAVLTSSVTLGGATDMTRMRLVFEGVTVETGLSPYAPAAHGWTFTARAPATQAQLDAVLATVGPEEVGFVGFFRAVAEALAGDGARAVTLADGRRSLEFVSAVYQSARTSLPVSLPLGPDFPLYGSWLPQ